MVMSRLRRQLSPRQCLQRISIKASQLQTLDIRGIWSSAGKRKVRLVRADSPDIVVPRLFVLGGLTQAQGKVRWSRWCWRGRLGSSSLLFAR